MVGWDAEVVQPTQRSIGGARRRVHHLAVGVAHHATIVAVARRVHTAAVVRSAVRAGRAAPARPHHRAALIARREVAD